LADCSEMKIGKLFIITLAGSTTTAAELGFKNLGFLDSLKI